MYKVGIIGPESTGKSTLARYLAKRYKGVLVPEYAREYMEKLDRAYTITDVETIAKHQIQQLQEITSNRSPLNAHLYFYDTELIVTKVWFEYKYGACPDWVEQAIRSYPMDMYLLCYPDIEWEPDPVRENPNIRLELFKRYESEILRLNIPYYIIKHESYVRS